MNFRVGIGYDVHQLAENYAFTLGGIQIPHTKGTKGHSDADVLIHSICDALLGAAAMGDIGQHFPDTSDEFKGIDSKILLKRVVDAIKSRQYQVGNIDATIVLQRPKIADYIPEMRETLAEVMGIAIDQLSIKATTTESMGFEGREEGVSAYSVALLTTTTPTTQ